MTIGCVEILYSTKVGSRLDGDRFVQPRFIAPKTRGNGDVVGLVKKLDTVTVVRRHVTEQGVCVSIPPRQFLDQHHKYNLPKKKKKLKI